MREAHAQEIQKLTHDHSEQMKKALGECEQSNQIKVELDYVKAQNDQTVKVLKGEHSKQLEKIKSQYQERLEKDRASSQEQMQNVIGQIK